MANDLAIRDGREAAELTVGELELQIKKIQEVMRVSMKEGEHYGVIPGTQGKPTLLKAGAEKLALVFRLAPSFDIHKTELPGGHREFEVICELKHIPSGRTLGQGVGSCSTMESKFRYRYAEAESTGRPVPKDYWKARDIHPDTAQDMLGGKGFIPKKIDGQWFICKRTDEKVENPDIADTFNTVLKMAKKRAQVDATLTATAASDFFTQDLDDMAENANAAQKQAESTKPETTKPAQALKTQRATLGQEILAFCNNDKKGAAEILKKLTGKTESAKVIEEEAVAARAKFKTDFLDKAPPLEPELAKPDDDIPDSFGDDEHDHTPDKTDD